MVDMAEPIVAFVLSACLETRNPNLEIGVSWAKEKKSR